MKSYSNFCKFSRNARRGFLGLVFYQILTVWLIALLCFRYLYYDEEPQLVVYTAVEGKNVTIPCRISGFLESSVSWYRDHDRLYSGRYRVLENNDLEINSVTFVDAGEYTCWARSQLGWDNVNVTLEVKERTKIWDGPEDSVVAINDTAIFNCSFVDYDYSLTLHIDWLQNGSKIDFKADQRFEKLENDSLLIIHEVTERDSGIYTCLGQTELDNATADATLEVYDPFKGKEYQVREFQAFPLDASSFFLSWKQPVKSNGELMGYEIYYQEVNGSELKEKKKRTPPISYRDQLFGKLVGLKAETKYRIGIHAKTSKGEGVGVFVEEKTRDESEADKPRIRWIPKNYIAGLDPSTRVYWRPNFESQEQNGSYFYAV